MRSVIAVVTVILLLAAGPAAAAIRIVSSTYEDGMATITGQTRPNQKVTLDGKFTTTSDGGGHFEFHVKYKPPTCMSDIAAGDDSYSTLLTGCLASDAAADAARMGVSPPPATSK